MATANRLDGQNSQGIPVVGADSIALPGTIAGANLSGSNSGDVELATGADEVLALDGQELDLADAAPNTVLAGPDGGTAAKPEYRALVVDDLPAGVIVADENGDVTIPRDITARLILLDDPTTSETTLVGAGGIEITGDNTLIIFYDLASQPGTQVGTTSIFSGTIRSNRFEAFSQFGYYINAGGSFPTFFFHRLTGAAITEDRTHTLPDRSGTIAHTDQIPGLANPTATVGTTAVNGTATSAMRSDAAPAIDQAMSPTWTGVHTFTPGTLRVANNIGATATFAYLPDVDANVTVTIPDVGGSFTLAATGAGQSVSFGTIAVSNGGTTADVVLHPTNSGTNANTTTIRGGVPTANRTITIPDLSGTMALTGASQTVSFAAITATATKWLWLDAVAGAGVAGGWADFEIGTASSIIGRSSSVNGQVMVIPIALTPGTIIDQIGAVSFGLGGGDGVTVELWAFNRAISAPAGTLVATLTETTAGEYRTTEAFTARTVGAEESYHFRVVSAVADTVAIISAVGVRTTSRQL